MERAVPSTTFVALPNSSKPMSENFMFAIFRTSFFFKLPTLSLPGVAQPPRQPEDGARDQPRPHCELAAVIRPPQPHTLAKHPEFIITLSCVPSHVIPKLLYGANAAPGSPSSS